MNNSVKSILVLIILFSGPLFFAKGTAKDLIFTTNEIRPSSQSDGGPLMVPFNFQKNDTFSLDRLCFNPVEDGYRAQDISVFNSMQYYGMQFLVAEAGGLIYLLGGAVLVYGVQETRGWDSSEAGYYIISAFYTYGIVDGVCHIGKREGRDGSFWWTLTSAVIGTGLGLMIENAYDENEYGQEDKKHFSVPTLFLPTIGAMTSYNISSHLNYLDSVVSIDNGSLGFSINALNYYQDACGGIGVKMDLLSFRF